MRKIRKSKPPEQAIEQYTFYGTVVYTAVLLCPTRARRHKQEAREMPGVRAEDCL
mgnify:CR=1 FL=1